MVRDSLAVVGADNRLCAVDPVMVVFQYPGKVEVGVDFPQVGYEQFQKLFAALFGTARSRGPGSC